MDLPIYREQAVSTIFVTTTKNIQYQEKEKYA